MTRDEKLRRLRAELQTANGGVFIIGSEHAPGLGTASIPLDRLLDSPDLGDQLLTSPGPGPIEVLAMKGVRDDLLRSLNHRRDQFRLERAVLLVFDPSDCARVSRIADDLWKWATVVELDHPIQTWELTAARGIVDSDRYAPALHPDDVVGPRSPLTAPPEGSDS